MKEMLPHIPYAVAALVAVVFLAIYFKKPIAWLIDRIKAIGPVQTAEAGTAQQRSQQRSPASELADELGKNPTVLMRQKTIDEELNKRGIPPGQEREQFLLTHLAAVATALDFERIYQLIYGSQISALNFLNGRGTVGEETEALNTVYYLPVSTAYKLFYLSDSFESWLSFLEEVKLVERKVSKVFITVQGRSFLQYLIQMGYGFQKLY